MVAVRPVQSMFSVVYSDGELHQSYAALILYGLQACNQCPLNGEERYSQRIYSASKYALRPTTQIFLPFELVLLVGIYQHVRSFLGIALRTLTGTSLGLVSDVF